MSTSDGSTADYYQLPPGSTELQHLISHRDMNAQIGEIFRACYRYGIASHSSRLRDAKKIRFYIEAEIARLEALELATQPAFDWSGALAEQEAADNRAHLSAVMGFDPARGDDKACTVTASVDVRGGVVITDVRHEEPAAQIDDESDRQKAVEQNGNDGLVYEDPWYGAPEWARFKAQDGDGEWWWYQNKPVRSIDTWVCSDKDENSLGDEYSRDIKGPENPNWRDTLIERP